MREEVMAVDCHNMITAGADSNLAYQLLTARLARDTAEIERLSLAILDQIGKQ